MNIARNLGALLLSLVCSLSPLLGEFCLGNHPTISVTEYAELIDAQRASVSSMLVSYTFTLEIDDALVALGHARGNARSSEATFAFSGDKRYAHVIHSYDEPGRPEHTERVAVYTGEDMRFRENKLFKIQEAKSAYSELNLYLNTILWPFADAEIASCINDPAGSHFLPWFLNDTDWEVAPDRQTIAGQPCVVMQRKDGSRKLFLDPNLAYALRKYVHQDPIPQIAALTTYYSDFGRINENFYLPRKAVTIHSLRDTESPNVIGSRKATLVVSQLQINDVPQKLFRLEPSPGEKVANQIEGKIYQYFPATDKTLEANVDRAIWEERWSQRQSQPYLVATIVVFSLLALSYGGAKLYLYVVRSPR